MSEALQAVAILHPSPGKENRLKEVLIATANKVLTEKGASKFQIFEQHNAVTGTNALLVQEAYADQAAVDAHLASPHFKEFTETLAKEELMSKPFELFLINPVGGFASR